MCGWIEWWGEKRDRNFDKKIFLIDDLRDGAMLSTL
jgi:hypothetical protein